MTHDCSKCPAPVIASGETAKLEFEKFMTQHNGNPSINDVAQWMAKDFTATEASMTRILVVYDHYDHSESIEPFVSVIAEYRKVLAAQGHEELKAEWAVEMALANVLIEVLNEGLRYAGTLAQQCGVSPGMVAPALNSFMMGVAEKLHTAVSKHHKKDFPQAAHPTPTNLH